MENLLSHLHSVILFILLIFCDHFIGALDLCSQSTRCGNQTIRFPLYIQGLQEPYCGNNGIQISCEDINNGPPSLNISGDIYDVREISYQNQSLLVSNAALSDPSTGICTPPLRNLSLPSSDLVLARYQRKVFFLYGCPSTVVNTLSVGRKSYCTYNAYSVLAVSEVYENHLDVVSQYCGSGYVVVAPFRGDWSSNENIKDVLRRGFLLNWTSVKCNPCERNSTTDDHPSPSQKNSTTDDHPSPSQRNTTIDDHPSPSQGNTTTDDHPSPSQTNSTTDDHSSQDQRSNTSNDHPFQKLGKSGTMVIKEAVIAAIIMGIVVVLIVAILCCLNKKKQKQTYKKVQSMLIKKGANQVGIYSYSDIKKITNSFTEKLGGGGFGEVFKGKLGSESANCFVAVKVLKQSKYKEVLEKKKSKGELELKEFVNEVASIGKTSHVNVVALLGFCFELGFFSKGTKRALIFEYMPNGSLDKFIFNNNAAENRQQLEWERCYQISLGIARGLDYLHRSCNKRIVHFDIKPQNILLDAAFVPKICDFGLSKIFPRDKSVISIPTGPIRGTPGYIAPEVYNINYGKASHKSDVYSYGMMVVDMVGGRRNINVTADESSEEFFPQWVYKRLELDEELGLQRITNEEDRVKVRKMIIVSLWCTLIDPSRRPTMDKVVQMLEGSLDSLQIPPKNLLYST